MKEVFENFDIQHLSASSINTWFSNPSKWILTYLYKYRDMASPAAWRGTQTDNAVGKYFGMLPNQPSRKSLTTVQEEAIEGMNEVARIAREKGFEVDDVKFNKEIALVPQYIATAVEHYKGIDKPIETYQEEVYLEDPRLPIPIKGFLDLKYKDCVRDIKTTARLTSSAKINHNLQVSMYAYVTGCKEAVIDYIYCSKYKSEVHSFTIDNIEKNVEILIRGGEAIQKFLSISDDKNELAKIIMPDFDNWIWSGELKSEAKKIWRI